MEANNIPQQPQQVQIDISLLQGPRSSYWDSWTGSKPTDSYKAQFERQFFVEYVGLDARIPLPTFHTYVAPGLLMKQSPLTTEQWRDKLSHAKDSQHNIYWNPGAQRDKFETHRQLLLDIFDWFHFPRKANSNFRHLQQFEDVMISLLSANAMDDFRYRFIDVDVIEVKGQFPIFSYPVSHEDAARALEQAENKYKEWFNQVDNNGKLSEQYKRFEDKKYYLAWAPDKSKVQAPPKFADKHKQEKELVAAKFRWPEKEPSAKKTVVALVNALYDLALELNSIKFATDSDIELEVARGAQIQRILFRNQLRTYFNAFPHLPYLATSSVGALLDYLARSRWLGEDRWKACQMKTGLFLWEQQGRVVFVRLVANLLYTYELLCKFRKPLKNRHNIYIDELPSFASGPTEETISRQHFLEFRDQEYQKVTQVGDFEDYTSETNYWYKALPYHVAPIPDLPTNELLAMFTKFACNNKDSMRQFAPFTQFQYGTSKKPDYRDYANQLKKTRRILCPFGPKRPINFGSVMLVKSPRLNQLFRYYVFSTTTGADHIFAFRTTQKLARVKATIYDERVMPEVLIDRLISKPEMLGVLDWYIQQCYHTMRQERKPRQEVTPEDDLALLTSYWNQYADGQDTIVMCLELQQRLMFKHQFTLLQREDNIHCTAAQQFFNRSDRSYLYIVELCQQVITGLIDHKNETNVQMLFVDIILRRFMFYTNLWYKATSSHKNLINLMDFITNELLKAEKDKKQMPEEHLDCFPAETIWPVPPVDSVVYNPDQLLKTLADQKEFAEGDSIQETETQVQTQKQSPMTELQNSKYDELDYQLSDSESQDENSAAKSVVSIGTDGLTPIKDHGADWIRSNVNAKVSPTPITVHGFIGSMKQVVVQVKSDFVDPVVEEQKNVPVKADTQKRIQKELRKQMDISDDESEAEIIVGQKQERSQAQESLKRQRTSDDVFTKSEDQVIGNVGEILFDMQQRKMIKEDESLHCLHDVMVTNSRAQYECYLWMNEKNKAFAKSDYGAAHGSNHWRLRFFMLLVFAERRTAVNPLPSIQELQQTVNTWKSISKESDEQFYTRARTIPQECTDDDPDRQIFDIQSGNLQSPIYQAPTQNIVAAEEQTFLDYAVDQTAELTGTEEPKNRQGHAAETEQVSNPSLEVQKKSEQQEGQP